MLVITSARARLLHNVAAMLFESYLLFPSNFRQWFALKPINMDPFNVATHLHAKIANTQSYAHYMSTFHCFSALFATFIGRYDYVSGKCTERMAHFYFQFLLLCGASLYHSFAGIWHPTIRCVLCRNPQSLLAKRMIWELCESRKRSYPFIRRIKFHFNGFINGSRKSIGIMRTFTIGYRWFIMVAYNGNEHTLRVA